MGTITVSAGALVSIHSRRLSREIQAELRALVVTQSFQSTPGG